MAPNRLLPGVGASASAALGVVGVVIAAGFAGLALLVPLRPLVRASLLLLVVVALVGATGLAAAALHPGRPSARVMLSGGFWLSLNVLLLMGVQAAREAAPRSGAPLALLAAALSLAALAGLGTLDALSLAVEARARAPEVGAALARHLALAAGALLLALLVSGPLALLAFRRRRLRGLATAVLNGVQVVPSIALFGLLVPGLSLLLAQAPALRGLGLSAIGATPTVIGVALYLALPLTAAFDAALRSADPAAVEAARAMGFTGRRIALEIRLPLGAPLALAGLRLALVQAIGLVTLGGLIGAGGLGALVFAGLSQFAADLILLGSLPVVALALLADGALRALGARELGAREPEARTIPA